MMVDWKREVRVGELQAEQQKGQKFDIAIERRTGTFWHNKGGCIFGQVPLSIPMSRTRHFVVPSRDGISSVVTRRGFRT